MPIHSDAPPESARRDHIRAVRVSVRDYPKLPGSVRFIAGAIKGSGTLLDISATGAHIWRPSKNVPRGVQIDLFFLESGSERKLHALGEVVRRTEEGFAVRFLRVERELEKLVLSAADDEDKKGDEHENDDEDEKAG